MSIEDHFDERGLKYTTKDLNSHQCSEVVLLRLSKSLDNWEVVGFYLGLTVSEIKAIKTDSNDEERRAKTLKKWKEKNGENATYYSLTEALEESGRFDLIDQALEFLKEGKIYYLFKVV